jgi:hypothetical protein
LIEKSKNKKGWKLTILAIIIVIFISPIASVVIRELNYHHKWMKKMAKSHLVVIGVDSTKVKELLGKPDDRGFNSWFYHEEGFFGPGECFDVTFKEGIVCSTDRYLF